MSIQSNGASLIPPDSSSFRLSINSAHRAPTPDCGKYRTCSNTAPGRCWDSRYFSAHALSMRQGRERNSIWQHRNELVDKQRIWMTRKMRTVLTRAGKTLLCLLCLFYSLWLADHVSWAGSFTSIANTSYSSGPQGSRSCLPGVIAFNIDTFAVLAACDRKYWAILVSDSYSTVIHFLCFRNHHKVPDSFTTVSLNWKSFPP